MTDAAFNAGHFGVGEVVRMSMSILVRKLVPISLISGLGMLPAALLAWFAPGLFPDLLAQNPDLHGVVVALINFAAFFGFGCLVTGALAYGTYLSILGEGAGLGDVVGRSLSNALPLLAIGFLMAVLMVLGLVLLIVPAFIMTVILFVVFPAAVIECPGVAGSFGRSSELTRGHRWKIFGILLVLILIQFLIVFPVGFVFGFAGAAFDMASADFFASVIGNAVSMALTTVFATVCYYQLRVDKDGAGAARFAGGD